MPEMPQQVMRSPGEARRSRRYARPDAIGHQREVSGGRQPPLEGREEGHDSRSLRHDAPCAEDSGSRHY